MKTKYLVAAAAMVLAMSAWAEQDVYPCIKMATGVQGNLSYYYVCGEEVLSKDVNRIAAARSVKVRQTYVNVNGQTMVGTFPKYVRHACKEDMCAEDQGYSGEGPFSGNAPDGNYLNSPGFPRDLQAS